jgi:hypothetical protein
MHDWQPIELTLFSAGARLTIAPAFFGAVINNPILRICPVCGK